MEISSASVFKQFEEVCLRFPERVALVYLGARYTYWELREAVERVAASLHEMGLVRRDKAIVYLSNCPQWIIACLALERIGAMAVPISPIYTTNDLKYMANDSGAETIFCLDTNFGYVVKVLPETRLKRVVLTNVCDLLPWWKRLAGWAFEKIPTGNFTLGKNTFTFRMLLKGGRCSYLPAVEEGIQDIFAMLYTSGTTGLPKGVLLSNIVFLTGMTEVRSMRRPFIPQGEDVVLEGGPLFHVFVLELALGALLSGDTLILLPKVNLDGLLDHIQRYKTLTFFAFPSVYGMILGHDRVNSYNLSSLKYCCCNGDVLSPELSERWLQKFRTPLYNGYSTTETCGSISMTPIGVEAPPGSAGKIAPLRKIKLVDPDTSELVPAGEPGELWVSSENMVRAYWNKPEETDKCFIETDGKLWYRTGDIVRIDKDGWLFYIDRSADIIKHKGYRVAAAEVEMVLQEHPAVVASCVVGIPDPKVGQRIKAFVVLREDVKGITGYDLLRFCQERLAPYKVPDYMEFRDSLPKSKVGKLLRRELRTEEHWKTEG